MTQTRHISSPAREICESLGWCVMESEDGYVELAQYSPAGEDFIITVEAEDFAENIKTYALDFDQEEHIAMWIMAKHHGMSGVPSARQLVEDAAAIDQMLQTLATALQKIEDDAV